MKKDFQTLTPVNNLSAHDGWRQNLRKKKEFLLLIKRGFHRPRARAPFIVT